MFSTYATLLSTLCLLASAQSDSNGYGALPTSLINSDQASKVSNDEFNYASSLAAQPDFTAAVAALASAVPSSLAPDYSADPSGFVNNALIADPTPDWFSAIPSSYQSYYSNFQAGVVSVATKDLGTAAGGNTMPTPTSAAGGSTGRTSSSSSPVAKSANAAMTGSPVLGAGVLGALGVAVAGAML